jgi:uncharacterized protein (DUF1015 family)
MSIVKPFRAIRPAADKAEQVSSHSVERYSAAQIQDILKENPYSFLHVIYAGKENKTSYSEQLKSIKTKFDAFIKLGIFETEHEPCFYIYRQVKDRRSHMGIIALASVEEYRKGTIRIHEQTLAEREEKLKEYLTVCDFNAEPVCLTHPYSQELDTLLKTESHKKPLYDFTVGHIHHSVWKISAKQELENIEGIFKKMPYLYIADGHHRAASSSLLAEMRMAGNPRHTGHEPYNFFTAAFFAETELSIFNFDRMVTTLNNHTTQSFLDEVSALFDIIHKGKKACKPASSNEMGLYMDKQWYLLSMKNAFSKSKDPVDSLDVSVLSNNILSPVLNITDLRNDKRIVFIPGIKDTEEIEKTVNSGKMKAAFCLYPISFDELKAVADAGKEMPPKSTWIEPKLESGLLVYSLSY